MRFLLLLVFTLMVDFDVFGQDVQVSELADTNLETKRGDVVRSDDVTGQRGRWCSCSGRKKEPRLCPCKMQQFSNGRSQKLKALCSKDRMQQTKNCVKPKPKQRVRFSSTPV